MNIQKTISSKQDISYKGSLRVECEDTEHLWLKQRYGNVFHAANERLIDEPCDDVLIVSPTDKKNVFTVYTDRNSNSKLEIKFKNSFFKRGNIQKLTGSFNDLSSGVQNTNPPKQGDVIALSGRTGGRIIGLFTNSKITHLGLMITDEQMMEAIMSGATSTRFEDRLLHGKGLQSTRMRKVYVYRLTPKARKILENNKRIFESSVQNYMGAKFSIATLLRIGGSKLGLCKPPTETKTNNKITCSELVGKIFKSIGFLPQNTNTPAITPRHILELRGLYKRVTRIV